MHDPLQHSVPELTSSWSVDRGVAGIDWQIA